MSWVINNFKRLIVNFTIIKKINTKKKNSIYNIIKL